MERRILILTDGKAGHENQSKALARALGCDYTLAEVHFKSRLHKAFSYFFDRLGIRTMRLLAGEAVSSSLSGNGERAFSAGDREAASPMAVIGAGSGTFYAAKSLARRLGVKCGVVLYPRGYDIASFDCILAPTFDRPAKVPNVIEIPANLVIGDAAFYDRGVAAFKERLETGSGVRLSDCSNAVAVIVGGPNKCSTMTPAWMKRQLDAVFASGVQASGQAGATRYWVTTSRRTPPDVEAVVDAYPWDFKLLYSKDRFNPIPAFVKLAKRLYVTAESTGMLSEACSFGTAEVVALDNLNPGRHKFRRFVEDMRAAGYVDGSRKIDLSEQFAAARKLMGL